MRTYKRQQRDSNPQCAINATLVFQTSALPIRLYCHIATAFGFEPKHRLLDYSWFSKPLPYQLGLRCHTPCLRFELRYPFGMSVFETDAVPFEPTRQKIVLKLLITIFLKQTLKESDSYLRFWRPPCYHYTKGLYYPH